MKLGKRNGNCNVCIPLITCESSSIKEVKEFIFKEIQSVLSVARFDFSQGKFQTTTAKIQATKWRSTSFPLVEDGQTCKKVVADRNLTFLLLRVEIFTSFSGRKGGGCTDERFSVRVKLGFESPASKTTGSAVEVSETRNYFAMENSGNSLTLSLIHLIISRITPAPQWEVNPF